MKKFIFLVLNFFFLNQAFAACEQERETRNKARDLCETLAKISEVTSVGGSTIGGLMGGPLVALAGGMTGLIPGSSARRACDLAEKKEKILQYCEQKYAFERAQREDQRKQEFCDKAAPFFAETVAEVTMDYWSRLTLACNQEIEDLLESYISSGQDLENLEILNRLEFKKREIEKKYFR